MEDILFVVEVVNNLASCFDILEKLFINVSTIRPRRHNFLCISPHRIIFRYRLNIKPIYFHRVRFVSFILQLFRVTRNGVFTVNVAKLYGAVRARIARNTKLREELYFFTKENFFFKENCRAVTSTEVSFASRNIRNSKSRDW